MTLRPGLGRHLIMKSTATRARLDRSNSFGVVGEMTGYGAERPLLRLLGKA